MPNVNGVFEIKMFGQRGKIGSIMIHIVAATGLARAPVPAAVMCDDPIAVMKEE
jgi:hypothetical protein